MSFTSLPSSVTTQTHTLSESNAAYTAQIQESLRSGNKRFAQVKGNDLTPKDYFHNSEFWNYAHHDAFEDWHYCLSKLQTKTEIISQIYIGTLAGALVSELRDGDYTVKSNAFYAKNNSSLHLSFKEEKDAETWEEISLNAFGIEHERIPFTRVISVVDSSRAEQALRDILKSAKEDSQYANLKEHFYVQLLDLPQDEQEQDKQSRQWEVLKTNFPHIFDMIDAARMENEPILIHCTAGRHRSVATLVAYLVDRLGLPVPDVMEYVRSQRGCAIHFELSEFSQRLLELSQQPNLV